MVRAGHRFLVDRLSKKGTQHPPEYRATFEWERDRVRATYVVPVEWKDHGNRYKHKPIGTIEEEGLAKLKSAGMVPASNP